MAPTWSRSLVEKLQFFCRATGNGAYYSFLFNTAVRVSPHIRAPLPPPPPPPLFHPEAQIRGYSRDPTQTPFIDMTSVAASGSSALLQAASCVGDGFLGWLNQSGPRPNLPIPRRFPPHFLSLSPLAHHLPAKPLAVAGGKAGGGDLLLAEPPTRLPNFRLSCAPTTCTPWPRRVRATPHKMSTAGCRDI